MAGVRVAHGQNPKLVGKTFVDAVDVNGKECGKDVMQIAAGTWHRLGGVRFQGPDLRKGTAEGGLYRKGRGLCLRRRRLYALAHVRRAGRPPANGLIP